MINNLSISHQYKDSPLGKIPSDWEVKTIEEIALKEKGAIKIGPFGSQLRREEFIEKGIKVYDQETAFNNDFFSGSNFISEEKFLSLKSCELKGGDIIISMMGTIGASAIVPLDAPKGILNSHLLRVRSDESIVTEDFLKLSISDSPFTVNQIKRKSHGGIMSGLSAGIIKSIELLLPPLPEQKAIAHILSLIDDVINKNNQLISKKKLQKKWLMQKLFSGEKRMTGFEKENWKIRLLEDVLIPISRPVDKPLTPFLALGIRSHGKGTFLKYDFEPDKIEMDTLFLVRENDLIVNITFAWEGAIAIVSKQDDGALVSHRFPTFTFNRDSGIVDFFRHFILQSKFKYLLDLISPGGAGRNRVLSKKDFLKLEVKIPSTDEQIAIAQVLQTADKEIQLLKTKTEMLKQQKKGLMQVLLTGKKRIALKK